MATTSTFEQIDLNAQIGDDLRLLQGMSEQIANLLVQVDQQATQISADSRLSTAGKAQERDQVVQRAVQQLATWQVRAEAARKRILDKVAAVLERKPGNAQEEILAELRLQRAWQRLERLLEAKDNQAVLRYIPDIVKNAAALADLVTLQAIEEELPAYLESRGLFMPSLPAILDEAQAPFLRPEQRTAKRVQQEVEGGYARLQAAFQMARRALEQGAFRVSILPGWKSAEQLKISW